MYKAEEGNTIIKNRIISGKPFLATKIGTVEHCVLVAYLTNNSFNSISGLAENVAGISPSDDETLKRFSHEYSFSLRNVDMIGLMNNAYENYLIETFCPAYVDICELRFLEPFYFTDPWSSALSNKKVLVVHPFQDSIVSQYSKRELLFPGRTVLPDFDLVTIKAEQTHGGGLDGSKDFFTSLDLMKAKVIDADFDVAIIGCGAYGLLIANLVKNMGKQAIHIGGGSQIMFGIKGGRWDTHPDVSPMYNEHWVRPLESERTRNHMLVENGTYW